MLGAFNDGLRVVLKAKELLHDSDETMVKFQKAMFNKYEVNLTHSRDFRRHRIAFDIDESYNFSNYVTRERKVGVTVNHLSWRPDWNVRLETSY